MDMESDVLYACMSYIGGGCAHASHSQSALFHASPMQVPCKSHAHAFPGTVAVLHAAVCHEDVTLLFGYGTET